MGQSESQTQKIVQKVYISNEVLNKVENYLQNNINYVTRSEQNIEQTVKNIAESKSEKNTETNLNQTLNIVSSDEMINAIKDTDITIAGVGGFLLNQVNELNKKITANMNYTLNTINNTDIVLNNDANVVSQFMASTTASNEAALSMSSTADISTAIENINSQSAALEQAQSNTKVESIIDKLIPSFNEIGKSTEQNQEVENIQDVRNVVQNVLSNRNINNIESATETLMSAMYSFHQENTVSNYQSDLETYATAFSLATSMKMSNVIEGTKINVSNSNDITINQANYAKQQFYMDAINTITRDNSFCNNSTNKYASQTEVVNYLESKTNTTSDMTNATKASTTTSNSVTQEAKATQTIKNTSISAFAIVIVVVVVIALGVGGYFLYKKFGNKSSVSISSKTQTRQINKQLYQPLLNNKQQTIQQGQFGPQFPAASFGNTQIQQPFNNQSFVSNNMSYNGNQIYNQQLVNGMPINQQMIQQGQFGPQFPAASF